MLESVEKLKKSRFAASGRTADVVKGTLFKLCIGVFEYLLVAIGKIEVPAGKYVVGHCYSSCDLGS